MTQIYLADLTPGTDYGLEIRARGGSDITPWSQKFEFTTITDDIAPGPPINLVFEDYGTSFMAMWEPPLQNTDGSTLVDLKDYEVTVMSRGESHKFYTPGPAFNFDHAMNAATFGDARSSILLEIRARDRNDNLSSALSQEGSSTPPVEVTGIRGEGGIDTVYVYWNDMGNDIDYYEVHAGEPGFTPSSASLKSRTRGMSTAFIVPAGFYSIKIRAVNTFELEGPFNTEEVIVGTLGAESVMNDTVAPVIPKDLVLSMNLYNNGLIRTSRLTAEWTPVPDEDVAGYNLRIRPTKTDQWTAVTVDRSINRHVFTSLLENTFYEGSISAFDQAGNVSPWSNVAISINKATDDVPPITPIMFSPRVEPGVIEWRWSSSTEADVKEFILEVATDESITQNVQTFRVGSNSYVFTGTPGVIYWGRVNAVDIKNLQSINPLDGSNKRSTAPSQVPSTYIANLEADKITAGQGFLNVLEIGTGGSISSKSFDTLGGFKLTSTGFSLTKGEINLGTASEGFVANASGDFWIGGITGQDTSPWRVDRYGNMRVGGDSKFYVANNGDMWVGAATIAAAPWKVYADGSATFSKTTITGDGIAAGGSLFNAGGKFIVSKDAGGIYQVNLAGNLFIDAGGSINVATGNLNLNGGNAYMSGGQFDIYGGTLYLRSSNMYLSGGTLDITGGQMKAGDTTNGVFYNSSGITMYAGGAIKAQLLKNGTAIFKGDITGANGTFHGTMSATNLTAGTITGSTLQTGPNGARVVISGNSDTVYFYNSTGQYTYIKQGLSWGIETSGSIRIGNDGNATGTGMVYAGGADFQHSNIWAAGATGTYQLMLHNGNFINNWQGVVADISPITAAAQTAALGASSKYATVGHRHPHDAWTSSRERKQDIEYVEFDALGFYKTFTPAIFRYKSSPEFGREEDPINERRFGFILEDLPENLRLLEDRENSIDIIAISAYHGLAIKQLLSRIESLEAEVDNLRQERV